MWLKDFEVRKKSNQSTFKITKMKVKIVFVLILMTVNSLPITEENNNDEAKGILDGLGGSTTTAKPAGGLGALPGIDLLSNTGPILVLGGFQAIVTKFDPSLVQGLPGVSGLPQMPAVG